MDKSNNKLLRYLAYAGIAIAAGFASQFLIDSIVALLVAVFGGSVLVFLTPVFIEFLATMQLKGIKFLSRQNPIETLELSMKKSIEKNALAHSKITKLRTAIIDYSSKLKQFEADSTPEEMASFVQMRDNMVLLYNAQREKLVTSNEAIKKMESEISRAKRVYQMTQASIAANAEMKSLTNIEFTDTIRKDEALNSVMNSVHIAMAELDSTLAIDYKDTKALETLSISTDFTEPEVKSDDPIDNAENVEFKQK